MTEEAPIPQQVSEVPVNIGESGPGAFDFSPEIAKFVELFKGKRPANIPEDKWNSKADQLGRMLDTSVAATPESKQNIYDAWCRTHGATMAQQ